MRHVFTIGNETADSLVLVEETAGYDSDYGISGDGDEHAHHAADMACNEQHDKDFQRAGFDTCGVYEWLIYKRIYQLCR